jgi:response regulator RpfG family c-di-GMP phosphodiesterase
MEQMVITIEKLLSDQYLILLKEKERLDSERQFMLSGITSLITALEARDHYTCGHSQAVAAIVEKMAVKIGLSMEDIESISIAGKLHDLGKIGVPGLCLLKPAGSLRLNHSWKRTPPCWCKYPWQYHKLARVNPQKGHHHERFDAKDTNGIRQFYPEMVKDNGSGADTTSPPYP